MKMRLRYPIIVTALGLLVMLSLGCAAETGTVRNETGASSGVEDSAVAAYPPQVVIAPTPVSAQQGSAAAYPAPGGAVPTPVVTPAPSGFVPGDALPAIPPYASPTAVAVTSDDGQTYREIKWEELVPAGYRPEDILAKYQSQLDTFQDGDPAAMDLYRQMQEEFNNAPVNGDLNQVAIKLPGFIAPLEYENNLITEFLLVPYFGACIHVPPPPVNQTVYVALAEGEGITPEESFYPVWVHGYMLTEGLDTEIGNAGYRIQDAVLIPYEYPTG